MQEHSPFKREGAGLANGLPENPKPSASWTSRRRADLISRTGPTDLSYSERTIYKAGAERIKAKRQLIGKRAAVSAIAADRKADALELRKQGKSYRDIGRELGVSLATAFSYVTSALDDLDKMTGEKAEAVRAIELERLDLATDCALKAVKAGDYQAVGALVKAMERRAKYLGLDMPSKSEITGKDGAALAMTFAELSKKAAE